jgi:hypothetical protein
LTGIKTADILKKQDNFEGKFVNSRQIYPDSRVLKVVFSCIKIEALLFIWIFRRKTGALSLLDIRSCHEIQRAGFKDPGIQE